MVLNLTRVCKQKLASCTVTPKNSCSIVLTTDKTVLEKDVMPLKLLKIVNPSNSLTLEQLKILQDLTQQTVLSIGSLNDLEEAQKRQIVKSHVADLAHDIALLAPPLLLEVAVEANLLLFSRYGTSSSSQEKAPPRTPKRTL